METRIPEKLMFDTGRGQFLSDWAVADVKETINQLIDYITELTAVDEKYEAKLYSLNDGWKKMSIKKEEVKPWPQYNDTVYAISSQMHINEYIWNGSAKSKTKLAVGMIQPTREAAEAKVQAIIGLNE